MPQFAGKIAGTAFNVPVSNGSAVDLTTDLERLPSVEETNVTIKEFADGNLKNIVGYTDDPIVSSDVIGCSETMLYDAKATMITANKLLKTVCWYDNGCEKFFSGSFSKLVVCKFHLSWQTSTYCNYRFVYFR